MKKKEIMIIADYSQTSAITLEELCDICGITPDYLQHLIEFDIIHPRGEEPIKWVFDLNELERAKTALRLQRDLEINLAGIALVLDLLEEIETLRSKEDLLEKHYLHWKKTNSAY